MLLEKTLESPLEYKEIQAVRPNGDQSWVSIGRTDAKAETPWKCKGSRTAKTILKKDKVKEFILLISKSNTKLHDGIV